MKLLNPVQFVIALIVSLMVLIRMKEAPTLAEMRVGYLSKDQTYGCGICLHCNIPFLVMDGDALVAAPTEGTGYFKRLKQALWRVWGGLEICKDIKEGKI